MIYADYAATTPVDKRVVQAILPFFTDVFYNASSVHAAGLEAQQAVMKARYDIARQIGALMEEIVFTSGATEAISLGVLGLFRSHATPERNCFVTCATEHAAMLDVANELQAEGYAVHVLGVDSNGQIDADEVRQVVNQHTLLLSVMAVNNETGVKQNLKQLAEIAHASGALFMTDATQAYGKMPIVVNDLGIDLMSFSAHKIYGPKGSGALYRRSSTICASLRPLQYGGGQEGGLRSGTLNVPGIVGLAMAGGLALADLANESARVGALRETFESAVIAMGGLVNGSGGPRSYNIANITLPNIAGHHLLAEMEQVACSQGSACSSAKAKPSHVLTAMGRTAHETECSLRFSFGRFNTEAEVAELVSLLTSAIERVKNRNTEHSIT